MDARKNFAFGTLAAGINNAATSLSVGAGEGARFPTAPFNAVIWNRTDYISPAHAYQAGAAEIVRVTAIATDTLTITRAQESTAAVNLNSAGKTYEIWAGPTSDYWTQSDIGSESVLCLRDDWVGSGHNLPWRLTSIGSGLSESSPGGVYPNLGQWGIAATVASGGRQMVLGVNTDSFGQPHAFSLWEMKLLFKVSTAVDSMRFRFGFIPWSNTSIQPANGIVIRYDTNLGDTGFQIERLASSVATVSDLSTPVVTATWYLLRMRSVDAGTILCSINNGTEVAVSTGFPSVNLSPGLIHVADASVTRTIALDFFSLNVWRLSR